VRIREVQFQIKEKNRFGTNKNSTSEHLMKRRIAPGNVERKTLERNSEGRGGGVRGQRLSFLL